MTAGGPAISTECHAMADTLRTPFFIVAVVLIILALLLEIGSSLAGRVLSGVEVAQSELSDSSLADLAKLPQLKGVSPSEIQSEIRSQAGEKPPGKAIRYLGLLDTLLLFTVALIAVSLVVSERVTGRVQGIATLIVSFLCLIAGIKMIFVALAELILMVTLFLAVPFGTLVYLAKYGFFDRGTASAILSLVMLLKLGFAAFLVLAQQRFVTLKGLVLIIVTSLIAVLIVSFLHGLVPGILVSITDAIAAIIVAILGVIWALLLLIGSLVSIFKAIKLRA
jgi:hypothetical protein